MAIQYVRPNGQHSVVTAYRLAGSPVEKIFRLRGLSPAAVYQVSKNGKPLLEAKGAELAGSGLQVVLDEEWRCGNLRNRRAALMPLISDSVERKLCFPFLGKSVSGVFSAARKRASLVSLRWSRVSRRTAQAFPRNECFDERFPYAAPQEMAITLSDRFG